MGLMSETPMNNQLERSLERLAIFCRQHNYGARLELEPLNNGCVYECVIVDQKDRYLYFEMAKSPVVAVNRVLGKAQRTDPPRWEEQSSSH